MGGTAGPSPEPGDPDRAGGDRGPSARRDLVRRRVLEAGFVRVDDLAQQFDVSAMTVHRDLDALAADGWLTKIRGGATANPSALIDAGVRDRAETLHAEKAALAREAATLLAPGQTLFVDDSTTVLELAPHLAEHAPITVVTNFLPMVTAVGGTPGIDVHVLGGEYHVRQEATLGRQTIDAVARFHADLVLMSTTGLTGGRCLHRSEATVMLRRAWLEHAARSVLLVDHAKFGRPAPHVLCDVEEFDVVVTDDGIDAGDLADLRARCRDLRVAPVVA